MTRDVLYPPEPEGSGWPSELHTVPPRVEERHLRAYRDRDLARAVDAELYNVLGPEANRIAVYANDAVITLEGRVSHPAIAREALELAWRMPGVRRVRNALSWRGR
jgi:osmotically-inducible protein OsmY